MNFSALRSLPTQMVGAASDRQVGRRRPGRVRKSRGDQRGEGDSRHRRPTIAREGGSYCTTGKDPLAALEPVNSRKPQSAPRGSSPSLMPGTADDIEMPAPLDSTRWLARRLD